jgi:hypothetical protein
VVDISSPASPIEVGFYDSQGAAANVAVVGDYAYVASAGSGLHVVNVADPTNPNRAGLYETQGEATGVTVAGNYIYVADGSGGLVILHYDADK